MKNTSFLHNRINRYLTLSPYPIWLAMIKPFKIIETRLKQLCSEPALNREEKMGHCGPLITRSRRWKYFSNGEFYLLYSRRQQHSANGLTYAGDVSVMTALKKWVQWHLIPSKLAIWQAEGFHG